MRVLAFAVVASLLATTLLACPSPKMPSGPPPEYEDPPAPSWLKDAGASPTPATPDGDAGVIVPAS